MFAPDNFFDLENFAHKNVFTKEKPVWETLIAIKSYLKQFPLGKIEGTVSPHAYLENPELITIGAGSVVEAGAYIRGPCIIGKECEIRHGAYIRGHVITGNQCVIGHTTELKNALLLDEAKAGHFAYIGDCILGKGVNLGAGVKCANLRLDQKPIHFYFNGQKVETQLRKLGAILGDGVQMGCQVVTNPGTLVGKNVFILPLTSVKGWVEAPVSVG